MHMGGAARRATDAYRCRPADDAQRAEQPTHTADAHQMGAELSADAQHEEKPTCCSAEPPGAKLDAHRCAQRVEQPAHTFGCRSLGHNMGAGPLVTARVQGSQPTHRVQRSRHTPGAELVRGAALSVRGVRGRGGHCRANSAHIKESRPDSGLGFQVQVLNPCQVVAAR